MEPVLELKIDLNMRTRVVEPELPCYTRCLDVKAFDQVLKALLRVVKALLGVAKPLIDAQ